MFLLRPSSGSSTGLGAWDSMGTESVGLSIVDTNTSSELSKSCRWTFCPDLIAFPLLLHGLLSLRWATSPLDYSPNVDVITRSTGIGSIGYSLYEISPSI